MKDTNHDIEHLWSKEAYCYWNGRRWCIDRDEEIPRIIVPLDRLVEDIASSKRDEFSIGKDRHGGLVVKLSPLAKRLLACAKSLDTSIVRQYLPRHKFSPYFELWESQRDAIFELGLGIPSPSAIPGVNAWVAFIRTQARSSPFQDVVKKQEKAALKNAKSTHQYLHDLFRRYSRLLVIRVDLGYRNDPLEVGYNWAPPPDKQVQENIDEQIRFVQREVDHRVGYILKIEYGAAKGHHCHLMVLLDGHKAREDITWGKAIGEHWEKITTMDGRSSGTYWNCNADKGYYARRGLLGIGLINYDDILGRKNLMRTAMYLAKADYYARFVSPDIHRIFRKGFFKEEPSGRGRPRKHPNVGRPTESKSTGQSDATSMAIEVIRRGHPRTNFIS